jgi:hypothetical protein
VDLWRSKWSIQQLLIERCGFNPFGLDAATGGQTGSQPISLDAIDQIQVATAPYDVTLSGFTGASVSGY